MGHVVITTDPNREQTTIGAGGAATTSIGFEFFEDDGSDVTIYIDSTLAVELQQLAERLMRTSRTVVAANKCLLVSYKVYQRDIGAHAVGSKPHNDSSSALAGSFICLLGCDLVTKRVESKVDTTVGQFLNSSNRVLLFRIDYVGCAEFVSELKLVIENIYSDDFAGVHQPSTLKGVQAHSTCSDNSNRHSSPHSRLVDYSTDSGSDRAADQCCDFHRNVVGHRVARLLRNYDLLGEYAKLCKLVNFSAVRSVQTERSIVLTCTGLSVRVADVRKSIEPRRESICDIDQSFDLLVCCFTAE